MTRRQSNNQWSGSIAAHPAPPRPKNIPNAKIRWKSSRLDFLGSRQHPSHYLSSKGPNYQRVVLLISAGAVEGHFAGKTPTPRQGHQWWSCSCMKMPRLTGHLQPSRNWPAWASNVLITKNRGRRGLFERILHSEFFEAGRGKPLCRHSIECCFVSGS